MARPARPAPARFCASEPLAQQAPHTACSCALPWPQLGHLGLDADAERLWYSQQHLAIAARPPPILPLALMLIALLAGSALWLGHTTEPMRPPNHPPTAAEATQVAPLHPVAIQPAAVAPIRD